VGTPDESTSLKCFWHCRSDVKSTTSARTKKRERRSVSIIKSRQERYHKCGAAQSLFFVLRSYVSVLLHAEKNLRKSPLAPPSERMAAD
jgi:hypothetical protein